MKNDFNKLVDLFKKHGLTGSIKIIIEYVCKNILRHMPPYKLESQYAQYPLLCRHETTDIRVFKQIFIEREYGCIDDIKDPQLIIDCGANVGYSSAYFLSRFPGAQLIAIEPERKNFAMLRRNLDPYNGRSRTLQAAIWSHPCSLTISETQYRDGGAWAYQVREFDLNNASCFQGLDIGSILRASNFDRISILKIDIEGAEGIVFSSPTYKSWINKVDVILIELHDDSCFGNCSEIFFNAIKNEDFEIAHYGELTICKSKTRYYENKCDHIHI